MAMMISKFNKMLHNRVLWIVILIIVVFAFVVWGMVWPSQLDQTAQDNAQGILNGERISYAQFRNAYMNAYLAYTLGTLGQNAPATAETESLIRRMAWLRLATLREAAQFGITTSDEELAAVLRANFSDRETGYNPQYYQGFAQNVLYPMGYSVPQFENHIREEITIQKLASMIGRQAQVTPLEVRRTFETLMDTFTVEYAAILRDSVAEGVSVTEEDAKALFDAEPALFTLPEQRDVTYVAIPLADYLDSSREFDEDALLDYYELHMQEYTTQETAEDGSTRDVVADFTEVQVDIADALRRREAMEAAEADASDLSFQALPNNEGVVPDFNAVAEAAGRPVVTLEGMSRFEVPVEDAGAAFTMEAFALRLDAYDRVSGPIIGTDHVYVIYLDRIHEPRVPMFEDIQDRALAAAEQRAVAEAMNVKAAEVKTAAEEGIAAGKSFEEAVRATGVEVSTAEPFTGLSASSATNETVQALVQAVVAYNTGEVTEPVLTMDGLLVAYVQNRAPADSALFESYSPEIASSIRNRRAEERFVAWQADLVSTNHFTDLQRSTADYQDENGFAEDESDTL